MSDAAAPGKLAVGDTASDATLEMSESKYQILVLEMQAETNDE
jgi:hypothetical protein